MMNDEGANTPIPVFSISMRFDFYKRVYFDIHYSIFGVHYSIVTQPGSELHSFALYNIRFTLSWYTFRVAS